jgi:hypothetical protein
MENTIVIVESLSGSDHEKRAHLLVKYGAKEARLEIPVGAPLFDREPGVESYRRELLELLEVLWGWKDLHEDILWPHRG